MMRAANSEAKKIGATSAKSLVALPRRGLRVGNRQCYGTDSHAVAVSSDRFIPLQTRSMDVLSFRTHDRSNSPSCCNWAIFSRERPYSPKQRHEVTEVASSFTQRTGGISHGTSI